MTIFTLYIGYMVAFVPKLPCSCGGIIQKMSWNQHLIFNVGFILLGVYAIWLDRYNPYKILLYNKPADVATTAGEANVRLR